MRKKVSVTFYYILVIWLLLAIASMRIPSYYFWLTGFFLFTTPIPLVLNLVYLFTWGWQRSRLVIMPVLVIVFAWNYYQRGLTLNFNEKPSEAKAANLPKTATLDVLSYNVRIFNTYAHLQDKQATNSRDMIKWVAENSADVYCLQEFYNEPQSSVYNSVQKIVKKYGKYYFISNTLINRVNGQFGMAIISKYPILNKGTIKFEKLTQNHAMFADLKIKNDTVRVYNFHLQSMSIEEQDIINTYREQNLFGKDLRKVLRRLKNGFIKRSYQVNTLYDHLKDSPYSVIVCGDLNDVPYSYTYQKLNRQLLNAHTAAGWGVGSTYNGILPLLRIDNQFFSPALKVSNFKVHHDITFSDHFPLTATYIISQ
ncbi:endonuclease/exonuclease/phosphatase family protein [Adhaeribacter radiodurans]|uniref:Endonuclease/exonuclease/phosphatase family protein n=1 Tax=Adhaeribacter radiodurans TaxID=2745197 RepID=A0A7L7L2S5_9BACT|nr:endonuclease/exonuclease/phosphatase family protein [Adhaeribacter radiodurans]QMU27060.1 endonuclease/exonuclease/phosphatase family protein [Adhaeribacter radiodurans]